VRIFGPKFNITLLLFIVVTVFSSCEREPVVHPLTQFNFTGGKDASFDIHGRVVSGRRGQNTFFKTGAVPIPFVQTQEGPLNINSLKRRSHSEHAGRASAYFLHARSKNILSALEPNRHYLDFSLSALDRRRALRTAIAQFPEQADFESDGHTMALFVESEITGKVKGAVLYTRRSPIARRLDEIVKAHGRGPLRYPMVFDSKNLIELFSFGGVSRETP